MVVLLRMARDHSLLPKGFLQLIMGEQSMAKTS